PRRPPVADLGALVRRRGSARAARAAGRRGVSSRAGAGAATRRRLRRRARARGAGAGVAVLVPRARASVVPRAGRGGAAHVAARLARAVSLLRGGVLLLGHGRR